MRGDFSVNLNELTEEVLRKAAEKSICYILGEDWRTSDSDVIAKVLRENALYLVNNDPEIKALLRERIIQTIKAK